MKLSPTAQATLLLTSYFFKASHEDVKPLTIKEWSKFALWMKEKSLSPADLLAPESITLLNDWHDTRISLERITKLLNRGHSLALAMEKWQRAGLWIVTRSDPEYPKRLKHRLKTGSPPVLFGCGNKALLNMGGLAVIGSRTTNGSDIDFTDQVGIKAAKEGIAIVSGGARGVDETAMQGSMKQGGHVIGVMADRLLKAATSAKWRKGLMNNHVVLISPFYPEAGFNVGNAMARNKYIYCLADSALVVHSGKKGGTITGARENLKKGWIPLWVKPTEDKHSANADLVTEGGRWCESDSQHIIVSDLLKNNDVLNRKVKEVQPSIQQLELFAKNKQNKVSEEKEDTPTDINKQDDNDKTISSDSLVDTTEKPSSAPIDFYQLFICELSKLVATTPMTIDKLTEAMMLHKSQLNAWLKHAEDDGIVKKLSRPVRYQLIKEGDGNDEY